VETASALRTCLTDGHTHLAIPYTRGLPMPYPGRCVTLMDVGPIALAAFGQD